MSSTILEDILFFPWTWYLCMAHTRIAASGWVVLPITSVIPWKHHRPSTQFFPWACSNFEGSLSTSSQGRLRSAYCSPLSACLWISLISFWCSILHWCGAILCSSLLLEFQMGHYTRFLNFSDMLSPWNFVPSVYIWCFPLPYLVLLSFALLCFTDVALFTNWWQDAPPANLLQHTFFFFFFNTCFVTVAWNQIRNISKVCLYFCLPSTFCSL